MRRYLVVANQTLGGQHLIELLETRVADGPCALHVLVPASVDKSGWVHDDASDRDLAAERLAKARERFSALGVEVTGEIGDHRPLDAILDVLRKEEFDEIILSTLPPGASRWLRTDLVSRVERAASVPVTHVVARPAPVRAS
ncbi:MAG TPA: universal stress protein [Egibacteraceae bacterium]|nr:universal stress protein [Egibacteraceae bacterium]